MEEIKKDGFTAETTFVDEDCFSAEVEETESSDVDEMVGEECVIGENNALITEHETKSHIDPMTKDVITQTSDFIGDDDVDAFKLLGLKSKINDLASIATKLTEEQNKVLGEDNDEFANYLDSVVDAHTLEEIKSLTREDIDSIFIFNDEPVELGLDFDNDDQEFNFKKDYLVMRKQTLDSIAKLDEEMETINAELEEHQEELNQLLDSFGDMEGLIRAKLVEKYENSDDELKKELYSKMIIAFDNALTLSNVITYVRSHRGRSIISDYRDEKKSNKVYRNYIKVMQNLEITTNLTGFRNLESKFLVVDDNTIYNKRPNIFIFAVIHYIASWHNRDYSKADGLFVTQLIINLKDLYYDKFSTEEKKENFINNIKTIIDIIG